MSVPKGLRGVGKLDCITKAYELCRHTDLICSNEKRFPKRRRWCTAKPLVESVRQIAVCCNMANNTKLDPNSPDKRRDWQNKALEATIVAETNMCVAYAECPLTDKTAEYWTKLLMELRKSIKAWRDSDAKRVKKLQEGKPSE